MDWRSGGFGVGVKGATRGAALTAIGVATMVAMAACGNIDDDAETRAVAPAAVSKPTTMVADTATPSTMSTTEATSDAAMSDVAVPTETAEPTAEPTTAMLAVERDLDIVTLLDYDQIPAINDPGFFPSPAEADAVYKDGELVLGVEIDGDARAYSVPLLSSHEIVNDVVGGRPIAVTW